MSDVEKRDIIQETLSLSKSGGIYFAGERVPADEKQMVLFVGLGGTGADALIRMKHQIYNRMKLPVDPKTGIPTADHPANVSFLALDTDGKTETLAYGNAQMAKNGSEVFNIGVSDWVPVLNKLEMDRENGISYAMWYPPKSNINVVGGKDGASGKRPIGRAAFFNRYSDIYNRVKQALDRLNAANPTAQSLGIFLFTGIAGGTGSGNYLDISYMLKELGSKAFKAVQVFGYVFLPDVNAKNFETDYLNYNGFSALKELDYFMEHGKESTHFFEQPYTATLTGTGSVPMDYCHLISAKDIGGHLYKYDDVMKSVVESVFCYIANSENEFSLSSYYNNVNTLLLNCQSKALYPAAHQYLSVGSASVRIPYMEITTLLAARMFGKMENTVFSNSVTKTSLQDDMTAMGLAWEGDPNKGERMLQDTLRQALERNVKRPNLDDKKYDDIWSGTNTAYDAAYNYIVKYQDAMNTDYANVLEEYEGNLRNYLKSAIRRQDKGPVYLANMAYSHENPCVVKMLRVCSDYYQRVSNGASGDLKSAEEFVDKKFLDGKHPGFLKLGKKGAIKDYIDALKNWVRLEEAVYAYKFMSKLALDLSEVFEKYYKCVLKDLKDTLLRVRDVFIENLQVLTKREEKALKKPDPSVLIYPLAFEHTYRTDFEKCVERAYNGFLDNLSDNLKYWIGREIDEVDQTISGNLDIEGRLSDFISTCFTPLYSTINMETILNSKKDPTLSLDLYVQDLVHNLYDTSYPMFNAVTVDKTADTVIISIPAGCPTIQAAVQSFVTASGLGGNAQIRVSDEKNRIGVVKIAVGFALYQNANINEWEQAYETTLDHALLHLYYGWKEYLPSPNVQTSWMSGYHCLSTEKENDEILKNFDRCSEQELISYDFNKKEAVLLCGNSDVIKNGIQLGGSLQEKVAQLQELKQRIWNPMDPNCQKIVMKTYGVYLMNAENQQALQNGIIGNIRANVVRNPKVRDALAEQCKMLETIREFEEKLSFPKYFSQILLCNLFKLDEITKDIFLKREESDPMPLLLLSYATDNYNMNASDFWYKLYLKVAAILESEARPGVTWKKIVKKNWEIVVKTVGQVESKRVELLNACTSYGSRYYQYSEDFKRDASLQVNMKKYKELMNIADFYEHAYTEMLRIYNDYK